MRRIFRWIILSANPVAEICRRFITRSIEQLYPGRSANPLVVDFGAGVSPYHALLARRLPRADYLAIDIAPSAQTSIVADISALPLKDGIADLIFCFDVLQHVASPQLVVGEMHRLLRSGGHGLITVPFLYAECDARDFRRWTMEGITQELEDARLEVLECRPRGRLCFLVPVLLGSFVPLLFPRARGWRGATSFAGTARAVAISFLVLPFHLLAWLGLALDRLLPVRGIYMGSMVLFRKPL